MLNEATNGRQQRGLAIAATQVITTNSAGDWMVPSQSMPERRYRVVKGEDGFRCACPDFELTGRTCKHGFAVEFMLRRETKPDGTVIMVSATVSWRRHTRRRRTNSAAIETRSVETESDRRIGKTDNSPEPKASAATTRRSTITLRFGL